MPPKLNSSDYAAICQTRYPKKPDTSRCDALTETYFPEPILTDATLPNEGRTAPSFRQHRLTPELTRAAKRHRVE